eukprot:1161903-Pelagomonas_calceolata.AAC.5
MSAHRTHKAWRAEVGRIRVWQDEACEAHEALEMTGHPGAHRAFKAWKAGCGRISYSNLFFPWRETDPFSKAIDLDALKCVYRILPSRHVAALKCAYSVGITALECADISKAWPLLSVQRQQGRGEFPLPAYFFFLLFVQRSGVRTLVATFATHKKLGGIRVAWQSAFLQPVIPSALTTACMAPVITSMP